MKVYVNAFELKASDSYTIDDFFASMEVSGYERIKHSGRERVMAIGSRDNYFCGVVLSTKDQRQFITIKDDENGKPIVTVQRTAEGELMADINFFLVNKTTGCGVFSTYRGAGGTTVFGHILHKLYRKHADERARIEIGEQVEADGEISEDDSKKISKKFKGAKIALTPIMTDPDFDRDLKKFKRIQRFEYIEPTVSDRRFGPVRKEISKQRRVYYFKPENRIVTKVRKFLAQFVAGSDIAEGAVHGYLPGGEQDSVPIHPEVYCLAKYPHDSVVIPENIRLDDVATIPMIDNLLGIVAARSELFE